MFTNDWYMFGPDTILVLLAIVILVIIFNAKLDSTIVEDRQDTKEKGIYEYGRPIGYRYVSGSRRKSKFARSLGAAKTGKIQW